jgi:rubrerythrin
MRRASLPHSLSERRASFRRRHSGHAEKSAREALRAAAAISAGVRPPEEAPDLAVRRAREAGGPVDQASYSCSCGYIFAARVSTSVACPVCGTDQAW